MAQLMAQWAASVERSSREKAGVKSTERPRSFAHDSDHPRPVAIALPSPGSVPLPSGAPPAWPSRGPLRALQARFIQVGAGLLRAHTNPSKHTEPPQ